MGLFDLLRRPAAMADQAGLMAFPDRQAALFVKRECTDIPVSGSAPMATFCSRTRDLSRPSTCGAVSPIRSRQGWSGWRSSVATRPPAGVDALVWPDSRTKTAHAFGGSAIRPFRRVIDVPA
jgi:hypothetical protein